MATELRLVFFLEGPLEVLRNEVEIVFINLIWSLRVEPQIISLALDIFEKREELLTGLSSQLLKLRKQLEEHRLNLVFIPEVDIGLDLEQVAAPPGIGPQVAGH